MDVGNLISEGSITEKIFFLLGSAMGVFYGFDGWRGTVKDVDFWKSPRAKNFLWVAGGGFLTFITDLKSLDGNADKQRLLLAYLTGFLVLGALVVLGWGLLISVKFALLSWRHPASYPQPPFSPFFDYLQYGYEYHRTEYSEALTHKAEVDIQHVKAFLPSYARKITLGMAAINSPGLTPERRKDVAVQILNYICEVVTEYSGGHEIDVNANYMIAYHKSVFPPELCPSLVFSFGNAERYEFYLALDEYARAVGRESFVVPVEGKAVQDWLRMSLPGAPLAFLKNVTVVVDDTQKIKYAKLLPKGITQALDSYFETKEFRSFASLNIVRRGKQLGILNVESNRTRVFGRTSEEKKEFSSLLHPFCLLLGELIGQRGIEDEKRFYYSAGRVG
jgi:hypothetical protein